MNPTSATNIDLRVVDFIKAIDSPFTLPSHSYAEDSYLCLGHFEVMTIREIPHMKQNLFEAIWDDYVKNGNPTTNHFTYPVYMLHAISDPTEEKKINDFWARIYPCIVIARAHHRDVKTESLSFKDALLSLLSIASDVQIMDEHASCGDLSLQVSGEPVHCAFYDTLELGDTAVVLKSNTLNAAIRVSELLLTSKKLGDIYSYCGLNKQLIREGSLERCYFYQDSLSTIFDAKNVKIPHVSMRFSIRSYPLAKQLFKEIQVIEQACFVTGTADAILNLNNYSIDDLITLIRKLNQKYKIEENGSTVIYSCDTVFSDIVTRVGLTLDGLSNGALPFSIISDNDSLFHHTKRIQNLLDEIQEKLDFFHFDWMLSLRNQTKTLLTMTSNWVTDDLSLLIYPSAKAFLQRLHHIIVHNEIELTKNHVESIVAFLNGWASLSNDIIHLESQLMQDPRLQAPRVHVPASLLAYYMLVLDALNNITRTIDNKFPSIEKISYAHQYQPLITHTIELRASTNCILDHVSDREHDYTGDCPLLVSLPISIMYSPKDVIPVLCHEYLHYSGEASRLRDERLNSIIRSCAGIVLYFWRLDGRWNDLPPIKDYVTAQRVLADSIRDQIMGRGVRTGYYIHSLQEVLTDVLIKIYLDWDLQSQLLTNFYDNVSLQESFINYTLVFSPAQQGADAFSIAEKLNDLLNLYHECYADVIMVQCLNLEPLDYLSCIFRRETVILEDFRGVDSSPLQAYYLAAQAAFVCLACWVHQDIDSSDINDQNYKSWLDLVNSIMNQVREDQDLINTMLLDQESDKISNSAIIIANFEYGFLIRYLKQCIGVFNKSKPSEEVEQLQKLYSAVSEEKLDLQLYKKAINRYHTGFMKR